MDSAIQAVLFENMPVKTAATKYGIPRSTLQCRLRMVKRTAVSDDLKGHNLMACAVEAVEVDGLRMSTASDVFGVSESTLRMSIRGARSISDRTLPIKFTVAEEVIKGILLNLAKLQIPFTKRALMKLVVGAAEKKTIQSGFRKSGVSLQCRCDIFNIAGIRTTEWKGHGRIIDGKSGEVA